MKRNTKVFFAGGAIVLSILILLITATPSASGSEISITEAITNPEKYEDRYITTEGFILPGSIDWNSDDIELKFTIYDEEESELDVIHHGVQPDNFSDDLIVIIHGYLLEDGTFDAERVQTRCPSTYEGEDPKNHDRQAGK